MKTIILFIVVLIFLGACSSLLRREREVPLEGRDYQFSIHEDFVAKKFILKLKSFSDQELCVSVDAWPNSLGQLSFADDYVYILVGDEKYPYLKARNFGYCVGSCEVRIAPRKTIKGFVSFPEFEDKAFIEVNSMRSLVYSVQPYFCEN